MKVIRVIAAVTAIGVFAILVQTQTRTGTPASAPQTRPAAGPANIAVIDSAAFSDDKSGIARVMNAMRQLEAKFQPVQDVREETLWGGVSTIHLTLVPKGNASFKYAEIWIDSAGMPVQTKVVEKNDDSTTMRLTGLEKNIKINSDDFNIKLDGDVKVVKS